MTSATDARRSDAAVDTEPDGLVRLLTSDGTRLSDPEWDGAVAGIDDAVLRAWLEDMVVLRRLDTTATTLQRQGELALWAPVLGQEAAQIGSARMLERGDFAFTSYREHGVAYCRGVAPIDMLREWRGQTTGAWDPYEVGMATPQIVVGAQALHAVGYAMGLQLDGGGHAAIAYFGDGATSEGDVAEAMTFAVAYGAPVVLLCQNNQWAISEPVALQTPVSLAARAAAAGMPAVAVDGNDVLAVAAVTRAALERARAGGGPSFIEAVTYRIGPHTTADDPSRYRSQDDVAAWAARDPILRVRVHLERVGALDAEQSAEMDRLADRLATTMREGLVALPDPGPMSVFDHVYVGPHPDIVRQRARYARLLAAFADEEAPR